MNMFDSSDDASMVVGPREGGDGEGTGGGEEGGEGGEELLHGCGLA